MNKAKPFYRLFALIAVMLLLGVTPQYATGAVTPVKDIILSQTKNSSRLMAFMDRKPKIKISQNKNKNEITLLFLDTSVDDLLKFIRYSDDVIDSVSVQTDPGGDAVVITLKFKATNITFFRTTPENGKGVIFDFKPTDKPIRITGITPERILAKKPVAAKIKSAMAGMDTVNLQEIEKRFASIDKYYAKIDKMSGRKRFLEIMKSFQKRQFAKTVKMSDSFIKAFPKSIYLEQVYFSKAEALYNLVKLNAAGFQEAIDAYNLAMSMFPGSKMYDRGLMRRADLYTGEELYIEALSEYGGLLKKSPKGKYAVAAMVARANIHLKRKRYQLAYNELEKVLVLFPDARKVRDAKYLIAESFHARGMYKEANIIFNESLKSWPAYPKSHPRTFLIIADTHYRLGNYDMAKHDFLKIANLFPTQEHGRTALLKLGELYTELNEKHDGAALFENLISRNPDTDEAVLARLRLASLGAENPELLKESVIFDYKAFKDPIKTFDKIFARYEEKHGEEALRRKGGALALQKRYVSSILAFKELFKSYPKARMSDSAYAKVRDNFLQLINTYHAQKGFFMTLLTYYNNFESFLRSVEDPKILYKIADSFAAMTLHDRAIDYYKRVINFDKSKRFQAEAAFGIAKSTLGNGLAKEAELMLKRFIKEFPTDRNMIDARLALGSAFLAQGETAKASAEWRIALELNPRHHKAAKYTYMLASMYKKSGKYLMAVDAYKRAIIASQKDKTAPDLTLIKNSRYQLAEAYYLDKDYPDAIRSATSYNKLYPEDRARSWMGYIVSVSFSKIEMEDKAIESFKSIVEKNNKSIIGRVASARLNAFKWKKKNLDLFSD